MMAKNALRVVSLVPSWTETLIVAGVDVVGRTRFCIHPEQMIKNIPQVGGTKSLELDKIQLLNPDFVILDQEENTKQMADQLVAAGIKLIVTRVNDLQSAGESCSVFGELLCNAALVKMAERYQRAARNISPELFFTQSLLRGHFDAASFSEKIEYVIWKNPFMVVGEKTFIADNLKLAGIALGHQEKYPTVSDLQIKNSFCLFSSEPFPFLKKYDELIQLGFRGVIIDGEKLSWFGIRNLNFLESCVRRSARSFGSRFDAAQDDQ